MKTVPAKDADPFGCPQCGNDMDITYDLRSNCRTKADVKTCNKCGCRWMDFYTMIRQVVLEPGEEFPADIEDD